MSEFSRETLLNIIETDHVQCGEASALARMALAAMDSEPVFTLEVGQGEYKGQKLGNQFGFITLDAARKLEEGNYQLYCHAQPAPVVPDELPVHAIAPYSGAEYEAGYRDGWNACRAAMLQAGNSPVIPEGYVMVPKEPTSEMVKKMRYHVGSYDRNIKDGYKAMLAAAPQEVKG